MKIKILSPASGTPTSGVGAGAMSARRSGAGARRVNGAVRAWLRSLEPSDWEIADVLDGPRGSPDVIRDPGALYRRAWEAAQRVSQRQ